MSSRLTTLSAVLAFMTASCANTPQYGDPLSTTKCSTDQGNWVLIPSPENADEFRMLASQQSIRQSYSITEREWGRYDDETWLESENGEIVLCLTDGPPTEAWASTWWRFSSDNNELTMVDRGATITVG